MYKALLERWQQERSTKDLQPLRDSFLTRLRTYIEQLLEAGQTDNSSDLHRQLQKEELANLQFMLKNLLYTRIQKIWQHLLWSENIDYDLLTRQERRFVEHTSRNLRTALTIENDLFAPLEAESSSRLLLVRFLEDHAQFVGVDLRTYGPFKTNDLATLPVENARVIIRKNGAEAIIPGGNTGESPKDS